MAIGPKKPLQHAAAREGVFQMQRVDRAHDLPLNRQARALGFSRGSVYYLPRAVPAADLAQQFDVHPNQITQWRSQLLEGAAGVFGSEVKSEPNAPTIDVKTLHAKIGELALEND